jgi:signal transduction histidine kinase
VPAAGPEHPLTSEQRHNVFLAFKEALTNVVRHSGATEVRIKISFAQAGRLVIVIEDNGRGLSPAVRGDAGDGLENLHRRLAQIGGQCDITSRSTGGVAVTLSLSLD